MIKLRILETFLMINYLFPLVAVFFMFRTLLRIGELEVHSVLLIMTLLIFIWAYITVNFFKQFLREN